jgi:hypothetical protein
MAASPDAVTGEHPRRFAVVTGRQSPPHPDYTGIFYRASRVACMAHRRRNQVNRELRALLRQAADAMRWPSCPTRTPLPLHKRCRSARPKHVLWPVRFLVLMCLGSQRTGLAVAILAGRREKTYAHLSNRRRYGIWSRGGMGCAGTVADVIPAAAALCICFRQPSRRVFSLVPVSPRSGGRSEARGSRRRSDQEDSQEQDQQPE